MSSVSVGGSANVDHVVEIDHRPVGGETVLGSDLVLTPGGKGANQAVAAGLAGGNVAFLGCVGTDGSGDLLIGSLASAGVDLGALSRVFLSTLWPLGSLWLAAACWAVALGLYVWRYAPMLVTARVDGHPG